MKRILNAAVILLTVLLSASLPVSAEQSQVGVNAAASTIVVRGKVVDEKNEPFAGVSIVAKKATNGVITGVDGTFEINVLKDDELEFVILEDIDFKCTIHTSNNTIGGFLRNNGNSGKRLILFINDLSSDYNRRCSCIDTNL